jgi:uncharacterized membrane protein
MKKWAGVLAILIGLLAVNAGGRSVVSAQEPVVNAVLFFSPTCPACHEVMTNHLPPLQEQYGDQLQILEINVQLGDGQALYNTYLQQYKVPPERIGVPALIVGNQFLVGALEIPQSFPGIIENALTAGGLAWPELPGVTRYLDTHGLSDAARPSAIDRFAQDPVGNTVSVLVLIGMLVSVAVTGYSYLNGEAAYKAWPTWVIPALVLVGLGAAGYLSFVELTQTEAICGPVGDCNAVQSSTYAYLFGLIPVGVLGAVGFLSIGGAWAAWTFTKPKIKHTFSQAMWVLALIGTLFSIYLTYLEPFVIGATCAWCITSAIVMTLLLWAATPLALYVPEKSARKGTKRRYQARRAR